MVDTRCDLRMGCKPEPARRPCHSGLMDDSRHGFNACPGVPSLNGHTVPLHGAQPGRDGAFFPDNPHNWLKFLREKSPQLRTLVPGLEHRHRRTVQSMGRPGQPGRASRKEVRRMPGTATRPWARIQDWVILVAGALLALSPLWVDVDTR